MSSLDIFLNQTEKPVVYKQKLINPRVNKNLYHVTLHFRTSDILASGTDTKENLAINKACCEAVERIFYNENSRTSVFRFDELNSTSCMAAGFNLRGVVQRSNDECVERYVKLLICDGQIAPRNLALQDEESLGLTEYFDKTQCYLINVSFQNFQGHMQKRYFILCMCWLNDIFVTGSSVNQNMRDAIDHSLVEAKRNMTIVKGLDKPPYSNFRNKYYRKIQQISRNGNEALDFFKKRRPNLNEVILPQICWQEYTQFMGIFVCRSFIQGYLSALENQRELF